MKKAALSNVYPPLNGNLQNFKHIYHNEIFHAIPNRFFSIHIVYMVTLGQNLMDIFIESVLLQIYREDTPRI